jgi:hypothetical protein
VCVCVRERERERERAFRPVGILKTHFSSLLVRIWNTVQVLSEKVRKIKRNL